MIKFVAISIYTYSGSRLFDVVPTHFIIFLINVKIRRIKYNNIATQRELSYVRAQTSSCGKCVNWRFSSAITWGASFTSSDDEQPNESSENRRRKDSERRVDDEEAKMKTLGKGELVDAGTWSPGPGVNMSEPMFPHVKHGFRGRNLPVSTFHVGDVFRRSIYTSRWND